MLRVMPSAAQAEMPSREEIDAPDEPERAGMSG
jgi:hypothetical protein